MKSIKWYMQNGFRSILTLINPKLNTAVTYYVKFRKRWDPQHPITLNDKILWLKYNTYWNNSTITMCVDKYRVRTYLEERGFGFLLNDLLGVYYKAEDIEWDKLPEKFAIKYNNGAGCNLIVSDKGSLDIKSAEKTINKWFKTKPWLGWAEMQYKNVKPCIIIEKYLGTESGEYPEDYKFYCFNGKSKYVMICVDRGAKREPKYFYFDREWNMMPFTSDYFSDPDRKIAKPEFIDEAFDIAEKLAAPFPFVRTDLYIVGGKIYFGELTFTPSAGLDNGRLPQTDKLLGEILQIYQ